MVDAKWVHTIPIAARYTAAGEYRFKSCPDYNAPLAQLVERLPYMQDVGGSNPSGCTKFKFLVSRKEVPEK